MKNDKQIRQPADHDCPVCRVLDQAQNQHQDVSLVELKIAFKNSSYDEADDDPMEWVNDTPDN